MALAEGEEEVKQEYDTETKIHVYKNNLLLTFDCSTLKTKHTHLEDIFDAEWHNAVAINSQEVMVQSSISQVGFYIFNVETGETDSLGVMNKGRYFYAIVKTFDHVYVIGGLDDYNALCD